MLPPDSKKPLPHKAADTTPDHLGAPSGQAEYAHQTAPPAVVTAPPSLGTLLHALRRCWYWALPVAAIVGGLAGLLSLFIYPGAYTSVVGLQISVRAGLGSIEDEGAFSLVQNVQRAKMLSHEVLAEAIQQSGVNEKYGVNYTPQSLAKQLGTHFNSGPEQMYVVLSSETPEAAAAILNAIGKVYPKVEQEERARIKARIAQMRRRLDVPENRDPARAPTVAEQLYDTRQELMKAEKDAKIDEDGPLKTKFQQASDQSIRAQNDLAKRQVDLVGAQTKLNTLRNSPLRPIDVGDPEVEESLSRSTRYQESVEVIRELKKDISRNNKLYNGGARAKYNAKLKASLAEWEEFQEVLIERTRERLTDLAKKKRDEDRQKAIAEARAELASVEGKLKQEETEVTKWSRLVEEARVNAQRVPPEVRAVRDRVERLELELKEIGATVAREEGSLATMTPRVRMFAEAQVPQERDTSRAQKIAIGVGLLAFMTIAAGLCLLEAMGKRVYSSGDVLTGLGMRIIGTLPRLPAAARRKSATAQALGGLDARYGLTEAIDSIRTVLMHSPRNDGARVILVTSAIGGEGKTTLASHLAASLARAWRKTLLIDGDLRKPALNAQFDLPLEPGLSEALRGEIEFDDCIKPTMTSRLWLMPAGKVDGHSLQALAQEGLQNVFEMLKEHYDFIVIDTSPVLLVPDGLLLAQQADTVVLSVMKDHSRIPAVYAAQQKLESLGIRVLGTVMIGEKTEVYGRPVPYPATGT